MQHQRRVQLAAEGEARPAGGFAGLRRDQVFGDLEREGGWDFGEGHFALLLNFGGEESRVVDCGGECWPGLVEEAIWGVYVKGVESLGSRSARDFYVKFCFFRL